MSTQYLRHITIVCLIAVTAALVLSALWGVPYVFTLLGAAAIVVIGHLVTIDDDLAGGWSNPDGFQPFPWPELILKIAVLVALGLAALFPGVRALGRG